MPFGVIWPFINECDDVKQPVTCGIYHAGVCDGHGWLVLSKRNLSYALPSSLAPPPPPPIPPVDDDEDEMLSNDFDAKFLKTRFIEDTYLKLNNS